MNTTPRIQLDPSRLLGFKQIRGTRPGKLAGPRAMVGNIVPAVPEPSSYAALLASVLLLGGFYLYKRLRLKKSSSSR